MGLKTVTGIDRQGFFVPYRYADGTDPPLRYPAVEAVFKKSEPAFLDVIDTIDGYSADLLEVGNHAPPAPRFEQDWFPRLDACASYGIIRAFGPKRLIEVGSGHSTRFAVKAISDGKLTTRVTAIDPAPRASIETLPIRVIRQTIQEAGLAPFEDIQSGDVVFIDSSHILMPGTDVDILFNLVIPALPSGVLIHIHDIALPDVYPQVWEWRGYNEQQAVIPMIVGGGFDTLWSSHYVATRMAEATSSTVISTLPLVDGAIETSLWLKKR